MAHEDPASEPEELLRRNIAAVHETRIAHDRERRIGQVWIDRVANFLGTPMALYLHVIGYGIWLARVSGSAFSLNNLSGISLFASLEAIALALFVLINQRHAKHLERHNDNLHLQMSLLTESKITKVAKFMEVIAEKMEVESERGTVIKAATVDTKPDAVLEQIARIEFDMPTDSVHD